MDLTQIQSEINSVSNSTELENIRVKYLGRNGLINQEFQQIKNAPNPREFGQQLNQFKQKIDIN